MGEQSIESDWRRTWPEMIVRTQTDIAINYLQSYYAGSEGHEPSYTGSRFEAMAALNTDPNTFGPEDFLAVSMLSEQVPADAAIRLLGRDAERVRLLLSQIPVDVDIIDVDPKELSKESPAGQLWELLRGPRDGLGPTRTSKLLAAKRPRLLPIWDSFVEEAAGLGTVGYWAKVQYVLADSQRLVWNWLGDLRSQASNVPASISTLRILDVLLWMSIHARSKAAAGG